MRKFICPIYGYEYWLDLKRCIFSIHESFFYKMLENYGGETLRKVNLLSSRTTYEGDLVHKQFDSFDFRVTYKDFELFNEKVGLFGVMLLLSSYRSESHNKIPVNSLGLKSIKKSDCEYYNSVYIPIRLSNLVMLLFVADISINNNLELIGYLQQSSRNIPKKVLYDFYKVADIKCIGEKVTPHFFQFLNPYVSALPDYFWKTGVQIGDGGSLVFRFTRHGSWMSRFGDLVDFYDPRLNKDVSQYLTYTSSFKTLVKNRVSLGYYYSNGEFSARFTKDLVRLVNVVNSVTDFRTNTFTLKPNVIKKVTVDVLSNPSLQNRVSDIKFNKTCDIILGKGTVFADLKGTFRLIDDGCSYDTTIRVCLEKLDLLKSELSLIDALLNNKTLNQFFVFSQRQKEVSQLNKISEAKKTIEKSGKVLPKNLQDKLRNAISTKADLELSVTKLIHNGNVYLFVSEVNNGVVDLKHYRVNTSKQFVSRNRGRLKVEATWNHYGKEFCEYIQGIINGSIDFASNLNEDYYLRIVGYHKKHNHLNSLVNVKLSEFKTGGNEAEIKRVMKKAKKELKDYEKERKDLKDRYGI